VADGHINESVVESAALGWLAGLGYAVKSGPDIAPGEPSAERRSYQESILPWRLSDALARLNPSTPADALEEAFRKLSRVDSPSFVQSNRMFHRMLVDGVDVEYRTDDRIAHDKARLVDFDDPDNNDWLAVNQFTVVEGQYERRPDIVIFLNGLPVAVIELKNPADEQADIWSAFKQFETYKAEIPALFTTNEVLVISDGLEARIGSLTANREWFLPWRTIEGEELAPALVPQLEVLIRGVFEKRRFLDYLRHFIVFEEDRGGQLAKKLAGYHQFHAVNVAVEETVRAMPSAREPETAAEAGAYYARIPERSPNRKPGDRRIGVVWHTQGAGKSLTMAFYAGRLVLHPAMENPTIVVITDRNDLDDQLFGTFSRCSQLLRQAPVQAESRAHLRELVKVASGGVVFTTIQKFLPDQKGDTYPKLSDRRNIVVIADEAHRSQYDFIDGLARHLRDALPNASFIGFTGTPIELTDKNTRAVFGDYISVYDIQRAVDDGATVRIYYESRLAKIELKPAERPHLDPEFEEITEAEEVERKEKLKTKWAALEALVGTEKRVRLVAQDLVNHFEQRAEAMFRDIGDEGKAMIVCMSRRICMDMYDAIVALRPDWDHPDDDKGVVKVVMTGNVTEGPRVSKHARTKERREKLRQRFQDPNDPFKVVIVRDMWLTGFDAPSLHTMYVDKPMRGHTLMQAIARVNRVFRNKPGGLVVDYLGLADSLRMALVDYTTSGGKGKTVVDQEEAVAVMLEKYEICCDLFDGFDWSAWTTRTPGARLSLLGAAVDHILAQEDGKARLLKTVTELSQAFALAVPHEKAIEIRDDVAFFQAVRAALVKSGAPSPTPGEEVEHAIRQLVSRAIASDEVIDLFAAAGLKKPDISVLSEEFLAEVRGLPQRNLAVELLRRLLDGEVKARSRKNVVQARSFAEMLEQSIRKYENRAIETAHVIEELIALAKRMREADHRGEELGLTDDEVAFYDALETNDSAVKVLGDDTLRTIARELVQTVRKNVSIDWTVKESVQAKLRVYVKRVLRKYGYPPDKQEKATHTVLEQAKVLCESWPLAA